MPSGRLPQNLRTSEPPKNYTYSHKNNNYSRGDNVKHCSADNTYYFTPKISNMVNEKSGDYPMLGQPPLSYQKALNTWRKI